jgi:hypothetical protein
MSNFYYGFAIPILAALLVIAFRVNAMLHQIMKTLKQIQETLDTEK